MELFTFMFTFIFHAARCPVPTLSHGTPFPLSNCSGGQCRTNDHMVFTCEPDYYLSGNGYITCVGYGEWDLPVPACEGKSGYIIKMTLETL